MTLKQGPEEMERVRVVAWVVLFAACVALKLYIGAYMKCGLLAFSEICAVQPLPHLLNSSPASNLRIYILPPAKGRTILAFHFPVQGFPFFADKCSPIHPDRCHIASLPFWYIASDPATCNKEPAPGTPLPRQRSDMGDYFKGASLVVLSAETLAGARYPYTLSTVPAAGMWVSACVWVKERHNNTTHLAVVTGHPDTVKYLWQRFMLLSSSSQHQPLVLSLTWFLRCDFTGQSWRNNLYKGKVLVLVLPAETHSTVALIIQGQSTSVNTVCQVKVKIRSHSI